MNKEFAIYPFRYMNITQRHDEGNHGPHFIGATNYSDKPWDEALKDAGRSYFEPQNDFVVEEVLGINSITTNTVRLKSVNKLYIPFKNEPDYLHITLTHMNEDNLKEVAVGQILSKGTKILLEGTDGFTTGNHFHITANLGNYYGFLQNNNGKWCYTYDKSLLPNEAFYLDSNYTEVINSKGYSFTPVPRDEFSVVGEPVAKNDEIDQIEIKTSVLYVRTSPSINSKIVGFANPGIYNYNEFQKSDGYNWYNIGIGWVAHNDEWSTIYKKKTNEEEIDEDNKTEKVNIFTRIFSAIIKFFKKIFNIK